MAERVLQEAPGAQYDPETRPRAWIKSGLNSYVAAVAGDSLVYLAGAGLIGIGNIVLLPLYTRCLSASEFGAYALLDVTILIVVTIAQLGLGVTYLKWFADLDVSRHRDLLGSSIAMAAASGVIGGAVLLALTRIATWPVAAAPSVSWLLLALAPIESVQGILLADLRARRRSVLFCAAAALRLLIMAGVSIWLVHFQRQGLTGVFLGRVIGGTAGVAMLAAISLPAASPRVDLTLVRDMLRYGIPLVWSSLLGVGMDASGRYLLAQHTGLDQVAIYAVALKISAVMQVGFLQPFGTAWSSIMFQLGRDRKAARSITSILSCAFIAGMTLAAVISTVSPLVLPLFGNSLYYGAAALIPWLLLPPAFRILEYWSCFGLLVTHRTGSIAAVSTAGAVLNVAAIVLLVPRLGAFGAALSWVLALLATIAGNVVVSRRYYRLPADWAALALGMAIWSAGAAAARLISPGYTPESIVASALGLLVVGASALAYGVRKFLPRFRGAAA